MIKMCSFCVVVDWVFHQIDGNGEMIRDFPLCVFVVYE
jgi:hypothetical protein